MSANQLANYQTLAFGELTQQDIVTVRETIGKDCNESQFKLFMAISKSAGANPVLNEIYPAVRGGQLTVQFGIDFYVRKAKESDGYQGYDVQLVHENDEFKMHQEKADDGRYYIVIDQHSFGFPRGKVIGGYAIAYKEGFKPFTVIMEVDEVEHYKKSQIGMQKTMWTNNFNDMFKKHMVRRALKAAFSLNFSDEDIEQKGASDIPEYQPQRERKDITPNDPVTEQQPQQEPQQQQDPMEKAKADMKERFIKLGITTPEAMGEYIQKHAKPKGEKPTLQEMIGLISIMDMDIEMRESAQPNNDELE